MDFKYKVTIKFSVLPDGTYRFNQNYYLNTLSELGRSDERGLISLFDREGDMISIGLNVIESIQIKHHNN